MSKAYLIAPSKKIRRQRIENAQYAADLLGLKLYYQKNITKRLLGYAGTPERRAEEIHNAFLDKETKIILAAQGGDGALQTLEHLNFDLIKDNPKPIIGFSDITILLMVIHDKTGHYMIHAPNQGPRSWDSLDEQETQAIINCVKMKDYSTKFDTNEIIVPGPETITGKSFGGGITLLEDTIATPFEVSTKNKILHLETNKTMGNRLFNILLHLKMAGKFEGVKAVILGNLHNSRYGKKYVAEFFRQLGIPCVYSGQFGHKRNVAYPIGADCTINMTEGKITYSFKNIKKTFLTKKDIKESCQLKLN